MIVHVSPFMRARLLRSLRMAIINEDNLNSSLDMPCNEMEVLSFLSREIIAHKEGGVDPEDVLEKAKTQFGRKVFSDSDFKSLYAFGMMVPAPLVRNLTELHFSLVPSSALRCPPNVFKVIANIGGGTLYPYSKAELVCVGIHVHALDQCARSVGTRRAPPMIS